MVLSALNYLTASGLTDLQAALDAAGDGDVVYIPGYLKYIAPAGGYRIRTSVELYGDGPGDGVSETGTLLQPASASDTVLVIEGRSSSLPGCHLHDFQIRGLGQTGSGGDGIRVEAVSGKKVSEALFERIAVRGVTGRGIALIGVNGGDGAIVNTLFVDCVVEDCDGRGAHLFNTTQGVFIHCRFKGNGGAGVMADLSGAVLTQCAVDGNDRLSTEGNVLLRDCFLARVDSCRFSNFQLGAAKGCVFEECGGVGQIGNCYLELSSGGGVGVEVSNAAAEGPVVVLPNRFKNVQTLVDVGDSARACIVFQQFDESGTSGAIQLPPNPNLGTVAVPSVRRATISSLVGVVLPAAPEVEPNNHDPTLGIVDGTTWFRADDAMRAFVDGGKVQVDLGPACINDLIVDATGRWSLRVRWTGWGADSYDLRRALTPIVTDAEFNNATVVSGLPTPGPPGTYECFADAGLNDCTTYYYAIKAVIGSTTSSLSNTAAGMTRCSGFIEVICEEP